MRCLMRIKAAFKLLYGLERKTTLPLTDLLFPLLPLPHPSLFSLQLFFARY